MTTPPNADVDPDDDIEDEAPNSELTELVTQDDFASHFMRRGRRLFHSHSNLPYPLPVDGREQERFQALHKCLRVLIGAHYVGPLHEVLSPGRGVRKVVDFGTGNGIWPLDMAAEMPGVTFIGIDIVPIATRYPPQNVHFELHDINLQTRFNDDSVDAVHARDISLAVHSFVPLVQESARILRSGGLLISGEWDHKTYVHPDVAINPNAAAPGLALFNSNLRHALSSVRGINPNAWAVPRFLRESGIFKQVVEKDFYLPLGPWDESEMMQQIGKVMRHSYLRYAEATRALFGDSGMSTGDIDNMIEGLKDDLFNVSGLVVVYHTVWARRF